MKKIITALGNQVLNNELKKINEFEIVANDLQYKEAIIELLEINKNVNYIILSGILPGNITLTDLITKIKIINNNIEIIILLEKKEKEIEKKLKEQKIKNVLYIDNIKINDIIKILKNKKITSEEYDKKQIEAKQILNKNDGILREEDMVSIIMPSYNTASYIKESIQSVLNQTYTNWELIIVDDCSTDETDEVLTTITDSRIKYFKNKENSGAAISRNKALREARGQWVAFLDSDDLWMPNKLEKQINFMKKNGYAFSYTNYEEIDMASNKTGIKVTGPKKITKMGMYNYCWPGCLTVMYDANEIGLIQIEDIKKNNDYAMWLKICKKANCYLLDEVLAQYRKGRAGSVSTHSIRTMIGWHYMLYHEAEKMGKLESLFNTGRNLLFGFYKKKKYVR